MVLVEPLFVVELPAVVSAAEEVETVFAAVVVVAPSVSSSFGILVVFLLGTAADLYAAVAVASSCSTEEKSTEKYSSHNNLAVDPQELP